MADENNTAEWDVTDADQPAGPTVAKQLNDARKAQGLSLDEMANRTRVPMRHLMNLEAGDYSALPGNTYTIGFVRNYAKSLGLDSQELITQLREELSLSPKSSLYADENYQAANASHIPPKMFAWSALGVLALILAGYGIYKTTSSGAAPAAIEEVATPSNDDGAATQKTAVAEADIAPSGPVILTATEEVWLRIYKVGGARYHEAVLKKGDSYTVPADADAPAILTGRPQALEITVGGKKIAPLGKPDISIADMPVDAASLLAHDKKNAPVDAAPAVPAPAAVSAPATGG